MVSEPRCVALEGKRGLILTCEVGKQRVVLGLHFLLCSQADGVDLVVVLDHAIQVVMAVCHSLGLAREH